MVCPTGLGGRRHFVNEAIEYIKIIWLVLGFKEMEGDMVQTAFWDLDPLFVPQDHPAREMQDAFYIKSPKKGTLPKEFKNKIKNEAFLEWEEVYTNNFYGTLKTEVDRIWAKGKHVIFDIDVVGGLNIKKQFPQKTLAVFVQPPSIEVMEQRLRDRGTDSEEKIVERVAKASEELSYAKDFDVILINDNLKKATEGAFSLVSNFINN